MDLQIITLHTKITALPTSLRHRACHCRHCRAHTTRRCANAPICARPATSVWKQHDPSPGCLMSLPAATNGAASGAIAGRSCIGSGCSSALRPREREKNGHVGMGCLVLPIISSQRLQIHATNNGASARMIRSFAGRLQNKAVCTASQQAILTAKAARNVQQSIGSRLDLHYRGNGTNATAGRAEQWNRKLFVRGRVRRTWLACRPL